MKEKYRKESMGEAGEDIDVCQDRAFNSEKSSIQSEIMAGGRNRS